MRVSQCYVSESVNDFPFKEIYSLTDYKDSLAPWVFIGMYRPEDLDVFKKHKGYKMILWTGQDSLSFHYMGDFDDVDGQNFTAHHKVYEYLRQKINVQLIRPSSFLNTISPQQLGKKIYAYCPNSMPKYHGIHVIDELRRGGFEIVIGDGQWTQNEWGNGQANNAYDDICIGLCLSDFAGGGTSIIEMGLRGVPVVTNVFQLANCRPWRDVLDVVAEIETQLALAGTTDAALAQAVWEGLDHEFKWLEI
jgi:hypothetical protein